MKNKYPVSLLLTLSSLIFCGNLLAQVPSYVPTNGLVGWWPFNGNANDESGNGNNGTVNGATLTTDRFGVANKAYSFSNNTNIVLNNVSLNNITQYSFTGWFKKSSSSVNQEGTLISASNPCSGPGGLRAIIGGNNNFGGGAEYQSCSSVWKYSQGQNYADDTWHFFAFVYNGSAGQIQPTEFTLFIDGIFINQIPFTQGNLSNVIAPITNSGVIATIGCAIGGSFFIGSLDDIGIWNRALTPNEITALYNNTAGTVSALNCGSFTQTGYLFSGLLATNVSATVPYTGGNGGFFAGQSVSSTGITGLTATLSSGTLANGSGTVIYSISGTPSGIGNAIFAISIGGQTCNLSIPVTSLAAQYPVNSVFCANGPTVIVDVTNPTTGRTWMDRNLGATQAATSSTDQNAYGDLYQWGRGADGHQCRTSSTTATLSSVDQPANGNFILAPNAPTDWRNPQNANLWQGVNGTNNPCPCGYRIPTEQEWDAERQTWTAQNANGGINSPLKISLGGDRFNNNGAISGAAQYASFWTSTVSTTFARDMYVTTSGIGFNPNDRADGRSIRCIKEVVGSLGSINCNGSTQSGNLYSGVAASNVSITVPYTGGNGGFYHTQNLSSTGVTGLSASIYQGLLANGNGTLVFTISGTATSIGTATFALNIGGQSCSFSVNVLSTPTITTTNSTICAGQSTTLTATTTNVGTPCASTGLTGTLNNGLVGYWPFCGNANDASGNGNNGTVNGATLTTDRFGNTNSAYSFDGVDDFIFCSNSPALNNPSISVAGWMNASVLGGVRGLVSRWNQPNNPCANFSTSIDNSTNNFVGACNQYTNTVLYSSNSVLTNQWIHFLYVHNEYIGGSIYINGTLVGSNNIQGPICNSINDLYIGAQMNVATLWRFFNGKLDDIGIWNRALTAAEIQTLYNQGQATYSWSPGGATTPSITVTPTTTTTYTCTITQNGATTTQSQTITVNPLPTVNAGVDQTVFAGSSVTLAGSGATTYSWNNGVTNNVPFTATTTTTYTLTGTTNGCSATDAVLVTVLPAATVSASNSTICAGASTTLTATTTNVGTPCASTGLTGTLNNGLVGYWPFCGNANDASGNGNNGTVNGATLTADRFGNANSAYNFNGNSNIKIPFTSSFTSQTGTISAWVKINSLPPSNDPQDCIFGKGWNYPQFLLRSDGKIYIQVTNGGINFLSLGSSSTLIPNTWYLVSAKYSPTQLQVFINGALESTLNISASFYSYCNSEYFIGGFNHSNSCMPNDNVQNINAQIDDVMFWNRSLTAAEIQTLYNQGQATYSWSPGGATTPSITVTPTTTTTYTCTITQNGATTTQSQTITVNPIPTVNAGVDQTVFAGSSVTLAGSGATTYSWDNGVANNVPFTATTTTTYTVTGTTNGCTATDAVLVTVLPAPTITPTSSTICAGQSTTLTANSLGLGAPCSSNGLPGTLNNGLVGYWPFCGNANDASGNGNNGTVNGATLTTDRFGNANSAYSFDGVNDRIEIADNPNQLIYGAQAPVTLSCWILKTDNSVPGDILSKGYHSGTFSLGNKYLAYGYDPNAGKYTFSLYNATTLNSVQSPSSTTANQWAHLVIVRGASIKMYIDGVDIGINANNAGWNVDYNAILANSPLHIGARNNLSAPNTPFWSDFWNGKLDDIGIWNRALTTAEIQALYNQGQATYSWSPGGATTPSITVSPNTTTTYTCTITQNGATTTQSQTITVNPVPTVNAGVDQTVFAGSSVTLAGSGATTYNWNNGVTNNVPFTATTTTTYTVIGTTNGCTATDAVLVTVLPAPTITPTSSTICAGASTTLTATTTNVGTPCASTGLTGTLNNGLVGYWPFCGNANDASGNGNNGTVYGANLTTDRFGNPNSAYSFDGFNDYVEVQSSALLNCNSSLSLSAWVNTNTISNDNRTIISRERFANGVSYQFTLTSSDVFLGLNNDPGNCGQACNSGTYASNSITLNSWQLLTATWDGNTVKLYSNGSLIQVTNLALGNGNQLLNSIMPLFIGKWMANTNNYPYQYFNGKLDDIGIWNRALTAAEIQTLYNQGQATYSWSPGGATTPSITVSPTTTTTYTCTITQNGATTTQSQTITVNPVPTVNAGVDQTVFAGSSVTLSGSGATTYIWNNGVTNNVPFTATTTTTYTVTGTTNGCTATDAVLVTVLPAPTITPTSSTICAGQSTIINITNLNSTIQNTGRVGDVSNSSHPVDISQWQYIAISKGPNNQAKIYKNGQIIYQGYFINYNYFWNQINLGASYYTSFSNWFDGDIDEIRLSNTVRSDIEILNNFNSNAPFTQDINTIGLWHFDQNTGSSIISSVGSTGTVFNATWNPQGRFGQGLTYNGINSRAQLNQIVPTSNMTFEFWIRPHTSQSSWPVQWYGMYNGGYIINNDVINPTYLWSPGGETTPSITVSPSTTTTYTCTVTQGGVTSVLSQTITVNPIPTVNAGVDQTVFAGSPVTLSGSGATTYSWNNGVTNNTPFTATTTTTYTVTGTTNGCTATDAVLVTVLPAPTITPTSSTICAGQSTTLTAASASTGTPCASTGLPGTLNNGLVGYWPFCGNANDASGNGRNGIVSGATLTTDRFGNANSAYNFTGTTNSITIPNSNSLLPGSFSVSSWCTIENLMPSNYDATIIGQLNGSVANDRKWLFGYRSIANEKGISYYLFNNSGNFFLANNYTLNWQPIQSQWYHISWVFESNNTIKTYVNGVLHSSVAVNQATFNSIANNVLIKIGNATDVDSPFPLPWNGKIDDVALWNRVLTIEEIQALYNQGQATYSWSPGGAITPSITVSPTATTTYTCTITQNGATTTQSQTITVNPIPTVNAGVDQTVFAGSPVTLSGSGATTYTWNNGVTNNVPFTATTTTTYTVTGTTNGCSATDAVLVTVLPNATISANPGTTLCSGQSTTLTANVTNAATPCNASGLTGTLNNGLVGYWPFCGNANDVSGNGNNGTVNGATLTTDRFGNPNSAYSFDGVNDFIQVPNSSTLQNISEISAFAWVNISNWFNGYFPILNKSNVQFQYGKYALCLNTNGGIAHLNSAENGFSNPNWQLNQWQQVGYIIQGGQFYIYINGNLLTTAPVGTFPQNPNQAFPLIFGADFPGGIEYTNGKLDDIGIWNRALTAAEIQTLYNQGQATYSWSPGGATTPSITVSPTTTTTYTCTVTLNGASSSVSQTVTVNPSPVVAITTNPGQTVCAGTPVTLTASGASSYSWNNGVSNGLAFVPTATQTYTVIGTNSFGCTDTETTTVTVNPTPTATISYTGSLILCQGSTITLTASPGSSYLWSSGQTTQSITVGQTGSYSVQVFNASGCSASSSAVNVTVNPLPAPTISANGPTTFCQGQQVTLTSSGAQSYLWNTSATTQSIVVSSSGSYTITVVDDKGCSGTSAPIQVTVIANPPANINVIGGTSICAGQTTTLSAPAGTGFSYLWNTGAQTQFLTVSQSGTYTVQVTNAGGCSTISASVTITVNPLPSSIVIASGPTSFCPGQSVLLTAPPANSYLWSNGATTASILVTTTGNYSVQLTGQGGCTVTSTPIPVTVFTLPAPTIFASGPTTFCQGGSVILSAPSGYTYLWTNSNTTQNIVVTNSGTYQVYISNSNGCQILSNPATVVVNPLPNVNAGMDQTVCSGTPVTLIASGASTFTWNNGVTNGVAFVPTTTQTYTVTGTNNFGCTAQDQVVVNVSPLPTVSAGPPQSICAGQSAVLVGTGAQFYTWTNGVINGMPFVPSSTQTYTVTGYNAAGCSNTATTTITVNALPTAIAGANATIICSNSATGVQIGSAPVNGLQYLWSPATGLSSTTVANPFANPTVTTLYNLLVTNTATGCSNQGTVTVNVNTAGPLASAGPNVEILCSSPNGLQIGTSPVLGLNYSWSPSTGLSATNIANPIANPSATTIYNLTVTNPTTGCSSTAAVTVFVNNTSPTVNAGPDQQVCQGDPVTLTASGLNANTYTWSNGVSNGVPFVPTSSGTYTLTGTNSSNGCVSTDVVNITVNPLPIVNAGPDQTICAGSAVVLSGSGALTYTWNNNVTNGAPFVPTATLTYTVTGTNANGCSATDNVMVTVGPGIIVNAGPDVTICAGSPVTLTATGANSYSWTNGVVNGQSFVPTATQTYTVTGTNPNGCSGTDQVTVTVVPNPIPVITPSGNISLCPNGSIVLSTTSGALYQWRLNGTDIPGANAQNYTATAAGVYTVKVTNANGCSAIATAVSVSLATATQPIVTANGSTNICNGGSVQFSTTGISAVQWYLNGLPISGATNLNYTANSAGSYTVGGQTSAGCTVLSTPTLVTLATIAAPNIIANGPTTICVGSSVTLSTSAVGTYQWLSNGSPIAGATNATLNINQPGNYALIYTNSAGCSATSAVTSITLGTPTAPTITPNGPLSLCNGGSVLLSATAAASYQWKLNGTNIAGATNQSHSATTAGGYSVTVVYPNGCSATSSVTMVNGSIVTTPVIVVNGSTSLCPGSSVELIASGSGSYQWLLNGNPIGTSSPNLMANTTGSYTVTVTNSAGCFATSLPTIITASTLTPPTINPAPTATFCPGGSVVLSTNATGNIQWKLNNQNISGATLPNLTCSNQGSYTVTVSSGGCTATSAPTNVTMASAPTVNITAAGNTLICPGSSVQLNATASAGSSLQWFRNGMPVSSGGGSNLNANQTGNYTAIATNAAGCQTTSNTITVNVVQVSLQATGSTTICQGSSVVLQASTGAGYTYQWIKNGNIAMQITGVSSYTAGVSGTYSVIIYTPNGCAITTNTIQVQVIPNPTVSIIATGSTTICSGNSLTLVSNTTGSNILYQWKRNGININTNGTSSTLLVTQAGTYTLSVFNTNCPSSSLVSSNAITVTVNPTPTPNISTSATIIPLGGSVTLSTTPVAGLTYQWQKLNGNNFQNIQNATGTSYQANTAGTYRVRATNASGCTGTSATINLTLFQLPVIEDPLKIQKGIVVEMYPNPTDNLLHIVVPDSLLGKYLQLMDINGKILQTVELFQKHSVLEMQNYARGTYWIKIEDEQPIQVIRN